MLNVETAVVGPYGVNCYLVWDETSGDGLVIDPGDEAEHLVGLIEKLGFAAGAILLTHGHVDHIGAVTALRDILKVPLYVGEGEEELLASPKANVSDMLSNPITVSPADKVLADEELLRVGSIELKVLQTPGHSPGGVCYLHEKQGLLFCGDTLFAGSIGRTDFPGCSTELLLRSINEKIMTLPDEIVCLSGHGPSTTVGAERISNPFLQGTSFA